MKKMFAFLIALLMVLPVSGLAADAVSSATVSITEVSEAAAHENAKTLVIWFSTNDTVKAVALTAADAMEADSFEIVPEQPYTEADLAYYTDGRCDKEQADASARPAIVSLPENLEQYDVIFIGYPIWHGQAPKILYTLLESIDLSGKTIVPFCTSMSSGAGSSADNLAKLTDSSAAWQKATRIDNNSTSEQVREWALSALEEVTKFFPIGRPNDGFAQYFVGQSYLAPVSAISHLALEVPGENAGTEWLEPVADEIYQALK